MYIPVCIWTVWRTIHSHAAKYKSQCPILWSIIIMIIIWYLKNNLNFYRDIYYELNYKLFLIDWLVDQKFARITIHLTYYIHICICKSIYFKNKTIEFRISRKWTFWTTENHKSWHEYGFSLEEISITKYFWNKTKL